MNIITKEKAKEQIAKVHPGSFTKMTWISDIIQLDEEIRVFVVCEGLVRFKVRYDKLKSTKEKKEAKIKKIMADSSCSREDAIDAYEKAKKDTWYEHDESEPSYFIFHAKDDPAHETPYIQAFSVNAKDISEYKKTGVVKERKVTRRYIANLGEDTECEIEESSLPKSALEELHSSTKKHGNPGSVWTKKLSDIIAIKD